MKKFMDRDFILSTDTAKHLFHDYAEKMPIIDYHCHINPQEIFEDRKFKNITEAWLGGDHYKWRIMRACGVEERYVTGDASDREKFQKYAESLAMAIGNPLYHWSHLELQRYFGYEGVLNGETAETVWNLANEKLQSDGMTVRNLIRQSGVEVICTTDDPADSLEWHEKLQKDPSVDFRVYPAWRPDKAMNIEKETFLPYLQKLAAVSGIRITDFSSLMQALDRRMDFFASMGCRVSDHGIDYVPYAPASEEKVNEIMKKRLSGGTVDSEEERIFKTAFLLKMGRAYHRRNWILQLHYGVKRNNNTLTFRTLGPDTGFDAIGDTAPASELANFLDALNVTDELPKTIVYSLNPNENAVINTIIGCFNGGKTFGKMQNGSAWWFNDHKTGMLQQMTDFANNSVLGTFVGMLTDSRSFLSYARHEYFRRILCELLGTWVENGEYPDDEAALERIVRGISYDNTRNYFGF